MQTIIENKDKEINFFKFTDYQQAVGHRQQVTGIDICQKRNLFVSGSTDQTVKLWNLTNNTFIQTYKYSGQVYDVVFSNDGNFIAFGGQGNHSIRLVDITDLQKNNIVSNLRGHQSRINRLAFSNDSTFLVSGSSDNTVRIWDLQSKKQILKLNTKNTVNGVAVRHDDIVIASISFIGVVQIWNIQKRKLLCTQKAHGHGYGIQFSQNHKMLVTSESGKKEQIKLWNLQKLNQGKLTLIRKFKIEFYYIDKIWTLLFSPCSRYIISIGHSVSEIKVFDIQNGETIRLFQQNDIFNSGYYIDIAISKNMDIMIYPEGEKIVVLRME